MSFMAWRPYVPVAVRRRNAQKKLAKMKKGGQRVEPVVISGRAIAASFWGKAWCENLDYYSDFANRLPRGRTYLRNGSVLDLRIVEGTVTALVMGSGLYRISISIARVPSQRWKSICRDCTGSIDSLVELLGGRLAKGVMDRVCRKGDGLFPAPKEIKLSCSCPDWADMCKHVAAALYGVGARLDGDPELLFLLRGVDATELLAAAGESVPLSKKVPGAAKVLDESEIADVFGIEMAASVTSPRSNRNARDAADTKPRPYVLKKSKVPAAKLAVSLKKKSPSRKMPASAPRRRSAQPALDS